MDEAYTEMTSYSTMSILSLKEMHSTAIIDQTYRTRRLMAEAIATQFYGCFITTEKWSDRWLNKGIAQYLMGLFVKKTFGNNEYRYMIQQQMNQVVSYSLSQVEELFIFQLFCPCLSVY